jgi:hypothetical protein
MTENCEFLQLAGNLKKPGQRLFFLPRSGLLEQKRGADGEKIAVLRLMP